jgi:hypothetical protein
MTIERHLRMFVKFQISKTIKMSIKVEIKIGREMFILAGHFFPD